ncbi:MAG: aspartate kinase [Abditibacteriales bacterium]|nr:aspartate kinase [Abditibacteriales bacterium]MDW8365212.1 aspartate kinase [Abditibacteriales bacterium]
MKKIIVQKFGGTSVSSARKRVEAAQRVLEARRSGYAPVVVVSAMGRRGDPYATDTFIDLARSIDPEREMEKRELDLLLACGELVSIAVMAHTIRCVGDVDTIALPGGQAGIVTDREFGNARILRVDPAYIHDCIRRGQIVIVAGFQGISEPGAKGEHGAVTTLGRGGSDATAVALGAALNAPVEIYTDVEGVLTADPNVVPDARVLKTISHAEICEMAHLGAKVVQARAAVLARRHNVRVWVKSPSSESAGTEVRRLEPAPGRKTSVAGVSQVPVAYVAVHVPDERASRLIELETYRAMQEANVAIHFTSVTTNKIEFVVARDAMPDVQQVLDGLTVFDAEESPSGQRRVYILRPNPPSPRFRAQQRLARNLGTPVPVPITISGRSSVVSIVAGNMPSPAGVMSAVFRALRQHDIHILQVADSTYSVSCLVPEEDALTAVRALHAMMMDKVQAGEWTLTDQSA